MDYLIDTPLTTQEIFENALAYIMMNLIIIVPILLFLFFIYLLSKSFITHKTSEVVQYNFSNKKGKQDLRWFTRLIVNILALLGILFMIIILFFNPPLFTNSFKSTSRIQNECVGSKRFRENCIRSGKHSRSTSQRTLTITLLVVVILPIMFNKNIIFIKSKQKNKN